MVEFDHVIRYINQHLDQQERVVIAISGFGGSGKSTLANQLQDHFKLEKDQIIHIDYLYNDAWDGPGIFDQSDWRLVEEILQNIQAAKNLAYTGRDYLRKPVHINTALPKVVIIEGVRLLQSKLMHYFDLSIWMDFPQEIALERAKARDRLQGESGDMISKWDTDWGGKGSLVF